MVSTSWKISFRCVLFAAILAIVGCQSAPVQEMSDARQAIAVAKEAGAADHAADDLKAAFPVVFQDKNRGGRGQHQILIGVVVQIDQ